MSSSYGPSPQSAGNHDSPSTTEATAVASPLSPTATTPGAQQPRGARRARPGQSESGRRSHTKSRLGCRTCRRRRVKCDETRPSCRNCVKHGVGCDFVADAASTSAPSPSSALSTSSMPPSGINMADLELMHNFTTLTFATLASEPAVRDLLRTTAVRMAVDCEYIMRSILAVSALHLARYRPEQRDLWLDRAMAHHQVASAVAIELMGDLKADEAERLHIFSVLTIYYALGCPVNRADADPAQSIVPHWLHLLLGTEPLIRLLEPHRYRGKLTPLLDFGRRRMEPFQKGTQAVNPGLLKGLQTLIHRHCEDMELLPVYDDMIEQLRRMLGLILPPPSRRTGDVASADGLQYARAAMSLDAVVETESAPADVEANVETSRLWLAWTHPDACDILVWQWTLGKGFLPLLDRAPVPPQEALVIFAHCLLVMRKLENQWWLEGWAEHLMGKTWGILDEEHRGWVAWVVREMGWVPPA